jgi:hypothetical protein
MSVYVDTPVLYEEEPVGYVGRSRIKSRWCHMIADTEAELLTMAQRLGLRVEWIQRDHRGVHFDIVPSKRAMAIRFGAVACSRRAFIDVLRKVT